MGGGNCLFGTSIDTTTPIFRGNASIIEVGSVDTNPSKLSDVEPLCAGKLDTSTTRCFDLFCVGKYEQSSDLKLNIQSADKIPNLVTKNADGNPVFCEPTPMCTIQAPAGHNVWVKIDLQAITTEASKYMCLGIRKRGESDYFDILYTGNMSRYVDVLETDTVELVPLISSTELPTYTPTKAGDTAKITDVNAYDFSSVYRVHITLHNKQWITGQPCNLSKLSSSDWDNFGKIGIGSITDPNGNIHENQMVAIRANGTLAYSSDGIRWFSTGNIGTSNPFYDLGLTYGNGIWFGSTTSTRIESMKSIDGGRSWHTVLYQTFSCSSYFANNIFIRSNSGDGRSILISNDAYSWKLCRVPVVGSQFSGCNYYGSILIYGNNKWIYGCTEGDTYCSIDGKEWNSLGNKLSSIRTPSRDRYWHGGCHANGYFYVIFTDGTIARSTDGENWEKVLNSASSTYYYNITYYKNKLYAFKSDGTLYTAGLLRPDGTIDAEL